MSRKYHRSIAGETVGGAEVLEDPSFSEDRRMVGKVDGWYLVPGELESGEVSNASSNLRCVGGIY